MAGAGAQARNSKWDKRVRRAGELAERSPHAAEVLTFYRRVLEYQGTLHAAIFALPLPAESGAELREQLDVKAVLPYFAGLLDLVEEHGPAKLASEARAMRGARPEQWAEALQSELAAQDNPERQSSSFFARVLLQPYAERLAGTRPSRPPGSAGLVCPLCSARPQAAVLHPEGDGGKRFLLCSFCLTEWEFRRVLCPVCGEEDYQKLPRYSAEHLTALRVEACDTCHYYVKSVDMTVDGLAEPLVDEVAAASLDIWAAEQGYRKAQVNIMGF